MKNIYKNSILVILALSTVYFIYLHFFGHNHDHDHDHEPLGTEMSEGKEKEVVLNERQLKAANIVFGTLEQKNLNQVINANGYTKLPPQNQSEVTVHGSGIVKKILIEEGQFVSKGQGLVQIESPEFIRLHELFLTSKSNLEYLKKDFERQKRMQEEEINAAKTFQKIKSDYETELARFNSLKEQLKLFGINENDPPQAFIIVRAPISGFIAEINIKLGTNITAGNSIMEIVDNSKLHVDLLIYEKDLYKVKEGQKVRFILTNQDNSEVTGTIFSIGKAFENDTKAVAIHAHISNKDRKMISGMYVNAIIDVGENSVKSLPTEAIIKAEGKEFVFVLEEIVKDKNENQYHFKRIEVSTGNSQLGFTEVAFLGSYKAEEKIAVQGAYYIQSHLLKSQSGEAHAH